MNSRLPTDPVRKRPRHTRLSHEYLTREYLHSPRQPPLPDHYLPEIYFPFFFFLPLSRTTPHVPANGFATKTFCFFIFRSTKRSLNWRYITPTVNSRSAQTDCLYFYRRRGLKTKKNKKQNEYCRATFLLRETELGRRSVEELARRAGVALPATAPLAARNRRERHRRHERRDHR